MIIAASLLFLTCEAQADNALTVRALLDAGRTVTEVIRAIDEPGPDWTELHAFVKGVRGSSKSDRELWKQYYDDCKNN